MSGSASIYGNVPAANALFDPNAGMPQGTVSPATTPNALGPLAQGAAAAQSAQPQSMADVMNAWAQQQNANAYGGITDPQQLAALAGAGMPMFQNPAAMQGHLADMIQGTVPLPQGQTMQAVQDEFQRQLRAASPAYYGNEGGGQAAAAAQGGPGTW